jgi:diguanylate cyclase (GGDEF)-like protein
MTMGNDTPEKKNRDHILGLETDIQKSMEHGFPFLVFSSRLEQHFLADTLDARKNRFSIMAIIAIIIYNLFLITDREMLPDVYRTAWKIRLWIVTPAMFVSLVIMRRPAFVKALDFLVDFIVILACGSIILILALSHHPNVVHYHTGIILVVMFGNIVVRLRFWHAFSVSWISFLIYILTVTKITPMTTPVMINSCVVLFAAMIISLIANYQMENDLRWNYLRNLLTEIETIRLGKANAELEHLSSYDALTELANRRHFNAFLDREWRAGIRYRTPLSMLFLDVDNFKAYNDHYGHQAGDICLQKIAAVIQRCVHRSHDLCARYGGEEFVVLLPNTSLESTLQVAEKIRKAVELEDIPHAYSQASPHVTISIGVVNIIPHPRLSQNLLIEMADKALYKAKTMGRNQIQVFDPLIKKRRNKQDPL